jgi:hypothetical protein
MARQCIFCGGVPVTREHAWPEWILRRFDATGVIVRTGPKPLTFSTKPSIEITVQCICEPCNTDWMSDLETTAQRWLEPMIDGASVRLDSAAQLTVASWATKTVMVFEHTLSLPDEDIFWRQEERDVTLQVESHRWREATGLTGWRSGPSFGTFLWPEREPAIEWPLNPALTDADLEAFAQP